MTRADVDASSASSSQRNPAMTSKPTPRDLAPLPTDYISVTAQEHASASCREVPSPSSEGSGLAIGLLLTILFFGLPLLVYCVLTSG